MVKIRIKRPSCRWNLEGLNTCPRLSQPPRDQFAMAALTALGQAFTRDWHNPNEYQVKRMAEGAYLVADAMLAARGGK